LKALRKSGTYDLETRRLHTNRLTGGQRAKYKLHQEVQFGSTIGGVALLRPRLSGSKSKIWWSVIVVLGIQISGTLGLWSVQREGIEAKESTGRESTGVFYQSPERSQRLDHVLGFATARDHIVRGFIPPFVPRHIIRFHGSEARVKISEPMPTFVFRGAPLAGDGSARDLVLVRLDKSKNDRILPVSSGATIFNLKESLPQGHIFKTTVTQTSPTSFVVKPEENLQPGEYLLTFGMGQIGGYDFTIVSPGVPLQHLAPASAQIKGNEALAGPVAISY
jgi:hypothetical protein